MTFNVMSIDPGGTTGWVVINLDVKPTKPLVKSAHDIVKQAMESGQLKTGEITGAHSTQAVRLYKMMIQSNVRVAIIEQFRIDPIRVRNTKVETLLSPVKVGSGTEALIAYGDPGIPNTQVVRQWPTEMGVITDERLRAWGLWVPGSTHIRAAMKHLLVYLRKGAVS